MFNRIEVLIHTDRGNILLLKRNQYCSLSTHRTSEPISRFHSEWYAQPSWSGRRFVMLASSDGGDVCHLCLIDWIYTTFEIDWRYNLRTVRIAKASKKTAVVARGRALTSSGNKTSEPNRRVNSTSSYRIFWGGKNRNFGENLPRKSPFHAEYESRVPKELSI